MSLSQIIVIGIIVLIVVPPEKLPEIMRTIGRLLNDIKRQTSGVWDDIKKDAEFKPEEYLKENIKEKKADESKSE